MIFSVHQVQEKCIEQNMDLVAVFIDLTEAFNTVNREALWVILSKLIRQFHDEMTGQVLSDSEASEPFSISNGVKQGCVLAPVLFNLFYTCLPSGTLNRECTYDIGSTAPCSTFATDSQGEDYKQTVLEVLFAEDCALIAHRESDVQIIVNKSAEAFRLLGLTISLGKTEEVLFQPVPAAVAH